MPTSKACHILFVALYGQGKFPNPIINSALIKLPKPWNNPGAGPASPIISRQCCGSALWLHQHAVCARETFCCTTQNTSARAHAQAGRHPHACNRRRQTAVLIADPTSRRPAFSLAASTGHLAEVSHSFAIAHAGSAASGSQVHCLCVKLPSCQIERA